MLPGYSQVDNELESYCKTLSSGTRNNYKLQGIRYHGMGYSQIIIEFELNQPNRYVLMPIFGSDGHAERNTRIGLSGAFLYPRKQELLTLEQLKIVSDASLDGSPLESSYYFL